MRKENIKKRTDKCIRDNGSKYLRNRNIISGNLLRLSNAYLICTKFHPIVQCKLSFRKQLNKVF